MISAQTLIEIAKDKSELLLLVPLLQDPDTRWRSLQDWLKCNPKWKKYVDHCVELPTADALEFIIQSLCAKWDIPASLLIALDRTGEMRTVLENQIVLPIQQAYKDRLAHDFDSSDGRRIKSPGKKRKNKSLKRQPGYIDTEIIEKDK